MSKAHMFTSRLERQDVKHKVTVVFNMWLTAGSWGVADVTRDVGDKQQQRVPSGD